MRTPRERAKLEKSIGGALSRLAAAPDTLEVQLLVQVVTAGGYDDWRAAREKAWRKQGGQWSTASWPAAIDAEEIAGLLLPVSAGRVGPALGKHPRAVAEPLFSKGEAPEGVGPRDLVLALVADWLGHVAQPGWRIAPPVVETYAYGQLQDRVVAPIDAAWHLPTPDGV